MVRLVLAFFSLALLVGGSIAVPARAQCRLCAAPATATTETAAPVKLEVEANLDFDRLVLSGNGPGTALISPDGSRRASGSILSMSGRAMAGTVIVRGEPGRNVRIDLPRAITLYGASGGQVRLEAIRSDLPALPRIGSDGTLTFRFGGELHVSGSADGRFRGDFQVDVDYL